MLKKVKNPFVIKSLEKNDDEKKIMASNLGSMLIESLNLIFLSMDLNN
jgi:hypothetical protein